MMKERVIRLNHPKDVQEFVNAATHCEFDINLIYQHIFIDAKSLIGVLGLLRQNTKVSYFGENQGFEQVLQKYAVA